MLQITLDEHSDMPIYRQIIGRFSRDIQSGILPAGFKLPTVRALSDEIGASRGTVKHAYDMLEQLGLIKKIQGSGTYVCALEGDQPLGKKEQALNAIDALLNQMQALQFSMRDIRIFVELKLREREQMVQNVRVGVVECSPEALSVIRDQVSALPHCDVYEYLLQTVLESHQQLNPGLDLFLTTRTHYEELGRKMPPGQKQKLFQVIMAVPPSAVMELARIPAAAKTGILCQSERFAYIVQQGCERYCLLEESPKSALFSSPDLAEFLAGTDQLIIPPNHLRFCTARERSLLREHKERTGSSPVIYRYEIEQGLLLYLEGEIEKIYNLNSQ